MMRTYLGADADGLDGFEFLTMAEAGEVGHWEAASACSATRPAGPICRSSFSGRHLDPAARLPGQRARDR